MRRSARGFSLIELLIAVAIGSAGIAAAGYVARLAVRSAGRGTQVGQATLNTQVIARQLRTDLEVAGYGSTGAIGATAGLASTTLIPPAPRTLAGTGAGFPALPAIRGVDNAVGVTINGVPVLPASDIVQIVVPDPARSSSLQNRVLSGANCTTLAAQTFRPAALAGCTLQYVSDHSGSNGAGRTQLMRCAAGFDDALAFDVSDGAELMCARWSTYWVDTNLQLHRSDFALPGGVVVAGLLLPTGAGVGDVIAPGIADLQVAYRLSTEAAGVTNVNNAWAFDGVSATPVAGTAWFEVRQARVSMLFRPLRAVDDAEAGPVSQAALPTLENRPPPPAANSIVNVHETLRASSTARVYRYMRMTTSQVLSNLKFFDHNLPTGVPADPY